MKKSKIYEAILVITTALLVIYLYGDIYKGVSKPIFIYIAGGVGVTGVLLKPLAKLIAIGWYKLAEGLSFVSSKIVLSIVYFLILFPVSVLYRLTNKDKLGLKRPQKTIWTERNHTYKPDDLKNIW
jgi:hypothetical protein